MDASTGQILYQQNGTEKYFPASTTKLLTALVAVEHGDLKQIIRVSQRAVDKEPDSATCSISAGDEEPLEYLLYGMLLRSGNDCADAIAEGVSNGNPEQFIAWMNQTAMALGATDSHFTNPHGLHDDNHHTTPRDLALIARAALSNPVIKRIAATESFLWPGKESNGIYYNLLNDLFLSYPEFEAGKTGFTEQAGHTLAAMASRDGLELIGVTMGYENRTAEFEDMEQLFEYGFAEFEQVDAVIEGSSWGEVEVLDGEEASLAVIAAGGFTVAAPRGSSSPGVQLVPVLAPEVQAPVEPGQHIGDLEIRDGSRVLGSIPLLAAAGVNQRPKVTSMALTWALRGVLAVLFTAGALMLTRVIVRATRRRRRLRYGPYAARRVQGRMITDYRTRSPR